MKINLIYLAILNVLLITCTSKTFACSNSNFNLDDYMASNNSYEFQESRSSKEFIENFFSYLSYLGNYSVNELDFSSLNHFVTPDITIQSNNEKLTNSMQEFVDYIYRMQKKYEQVQYSNFLEDPIIAGNKIVIHFHVYCTPKLGQKRLLDVIAIVTIQDGKIRDWTEVFQEIL